MLLLQLPRTYCTCTAMLHAGKQQSVSMACAVCACAQAGLPLLLAFVARLSHGPCNRQIVPSTLLNSCALLWSCWCRC